DDLSLLNIVKPERLDDRTEAVDLNKLKRAGKAANKAVHLEQKAVVRLETPRYLRLAKLAIWAGVFALAGYAALQREAILDLVQELPSPIPRLEKVAPGGMSELRAAAAVDLKRSPTLALVPAGDAGFYLASNLPDGTTFTLT